MRPIIIANVFPASCALSVEEKNNMDYQVTFYKKIEIKFKNCEFFKTWMKSTKADFFFLHY